MTFEWDDTKDRANLKKHGVSFEEAQAAFADPARVVVRDEAHSTASETRYYCYGKVEGTVLTVRFTFRGNVIRIFGAGYWRKGVQYYEDS
jgi:uncharacterized DUF497 family protein